MVFNLVPLTASPANVSSLERSTPASPNSSGTCLQHPTGAKKFNTFKVLTRSVSKSSLNTQNRPMHPAGACIPSSLLQL